MSTTKILFINIKNFRSLRDVKLDEVNDLNILVGKNSCGKSNLLEGLDLFFSEFALVGGTTTGLDPFFWYNKGTTKPIEFIVLIQLTDFECDEIFPQEILKMVKKIHPETFNQLKIHRKIINLQGAWNTESLAWANVPLVKNNKPLSSLKPATTPPKPLRILITPEMLSHIHKGITQMIKNRFQLVPQIRDVKSPITYRMTLIDSQLQSSLWTLDQSTKDLDEQMYSEIETAFGRITGKRLDPAHGQVFIRRGVRRFPISLEGGGVQAAINLIVVLKKELEKGYVFGIEEPEAHSHTDLQRKLFGELKSLSSVGQIFITTHSPTFIDRADLSNTWIVKFSNGETRIERINGLKEIIEELGIRPSDILFFADRILFVEGKSEEIVIPVFAKKLGIDLKDVAIIPVEGKDKARLHLETWVRTTRNMCPLFLLLDNDARKEAEELERNKLIEPQRYHVWQRGSIESYYPLDILSDALKELNSRYSLEMNVDAIMKRIKKGTLPPDKIDIGEKSELLDKSWEVVLAESLARLLDIKPVDIDDEVRIALESAVA